MVFIWLFIFSFNYYGVGCMNLNHLYFDVFKIGLMAVLSFFAIGLALSIPLCLLWNWLMPKIFNLPTLNLIEAFGLSALITFL